MRLLPIVPILLSIGALVLGFLCLFAGSKPNFMEGYSILTLNTSRIGHNVINTTSSSSGNPFSALFHNLTDSRVNELKSDINNFATSLAKDLGLKDFYNVHMLDYCYGSFTPQAVPNATVKASKIHKNVTACSNRTAMYTFDPTAALEKSLNESGVSITLADLNWSADLEKGIKALRIAAKVAFVAYCIGIAFAFLTILAAAFWMFSGGRLSASVEIFTAVMAFTTLGIATAITTVVAVQGNSVIDKYGEPIGVSADRGTGFLGLTWAATGLMFICSILGCAGCFRSRKRESVKQYQ
ncbi:putative sur7 protein [Venturia nashicola]|uniref:Putative sur7 protein n=1 Tax=Venturia nashicola TaxID=86259 RepID=A0A4Z1NLS3_9PEZI|nr:putative sur7 protein [Venturia nashicola]TLD25741.1 putative sur7 protein [Venturia nashicola]